MVMSIDAVMEKNQQTGRGYDADGGVRALTPQEFLEISTEIGATQHFEGYRHLHEHFAAWIAGELGIQTSLEIGSGPGYLLNCLNRLGVNAKGIDGNTFSQELFCTLHPEYAHQYAIDPLFTSSYAHVDAVLSIEVFEHIPDEGLAAAMTKIKNELRPKYIVFSSTPYADPHAGWDIQWGHINIKQPAEWDALFASYGYEPVRDKKPPVTPWATLYQPRKKQPFLSYTFALQQG